MGKIIDYINTLPFDKEYERIFRRPMPVGKVFCPFHPNTNTPSGKLYGNILHCFSCNRNYTTYDLLKKYDPDKINQISQTQIIMPVERKQDYKTMYIKVDRSNDLYQILTQIKQNADV